MNVTLAGMDELEQFPDAQSRERALHEMGSSIGLVDWLIGLAVCVAAGAGSLWLARLLVRGLLPMVLPWPLHRNVQDILVFALVIGVMFLTVRMLHRWGAARELREKLVTCGVPVCRACGYILRGLPADSTTCPECGGAIDANVLALIKAPDAPQDASST